MRSGRSVGEAIDIVVAKRVGVQVLARLNTDDRTLVKGKKNRSVFIKKLANSFKGEGEFKIGRAHV